MTDLAITASNVVADSKARVLYGSCGETITAGQAVYIAAATKKWMRADSNSPEAEVRKAIGIALNGGSINQPIRVLQRGKITLGATLVPGSAYYLSDNPGGICGAADVVAGDYICQLGLASSATVLNLAIQFPNVITAGAGPSARNLAAAQALAGLAQAVSLFQGPKYGLVAEGNSITLGTSPVIGGGPYSDQYLAYSNVIFDSSILAVNGSTLAGMASRASSIDAILPSNLTGRTYVLSALIGANDLKDYPGPSDAAAAASYTADLFSYYDARRSAGWKMIGATMLPRDDSAAHNTRRAIVNANIVASVGVHCDAVADFASDSQMGPDDARAVTPANWWDGMHPSDLGHIRMEAIYRPAVNSVVPVDRPAPSVPVFQVDLTAISSLPPDLQFGRASPATCFDSSGALQVKTNDVPRFYYDPVTLAARGVPIEEIRTNIFLNSGTPVTQTVAVSNGTIYTVSFYGTGSMALTGAVSHTITGTSAAGRVEYTFTAGSTSLVATLSGIVNYPQVEPGGSASSYIPTTSSAATRREDIFQLKRSALATVRGTIGTVIIQGAFFRPSGQVQLLSGGSIQGMTISTDGVTWQYYNGAANIVTSPSNDIRAQAVRGAIAWDGTGRSAFATGASSVGTDLTPDPSHYNMTWHIGSRFDASDNFVNGYIQAIAVYSTRLSDSEIAAKCVVGAAF